MKKNSAKYMSEFSLKLYNICQRIPAFRYFKVILYYVDFFCYYLYESQNM